jgi:hypothetical protein
MSNRLPIHSPMFRSKKKLADKRSDQLHKYLFASLLLASVFCCVVKPSLASDGTSGVRQLAPGVVPPAGAPPPPGRSPNPEPVTPGDAPLTRARVASGKADRTPGSSFPHQYEKVKVPDQFYQYQRSNNNYTRADGIGTRMVLPDGWPAKRNFQPGGPIVDQQLFDMQAEKYPYPGTTVGPTRTRRIVTATGVTIEYRVPSRQILSDRRGRRYPHYLPQEAWQREEAREPIPTLRPFCRMLVIAGVVFATVYMIFAALAVTLGHPYAGQRAIGTAAGLILLLMGYSIYKVVMIDAFRLNNSIDTTMRTGQLRPQQDLGPSDTPGLPASPIDPRRSRANLPVYPFANARNP